MICVDAVVCTFQKRRLWGYGATAARLTPDQKVGTSDLSGLTLHAAWVLGTHRKKRRRGEVLRQ